MVNLREFSVTLTTYVIVSGDVTVEASSIDEAKKKAREDFQRASWPVDGSGTSVVPEDAHPIAIDRVRDVRAGTQAWLDEPALPPVMSAAPDMLAALRLALPLCEDAYNDALALQAEPSEYPAERAQSTAAALAAWEAVAAAIAKAEGRADG